MSAASNFNRKCYIFILLFVIPSIQSATLIIKNNCPFPLAVHPVLSVQDEYVTKFKYSIPGGRDVTYRSGIYSIKGVRWKKTMVNRDWKTFITLDYITTDMPTISLFNDKALFEIDSNALYRYYPDKNKLNHYFESSGTLVAANLYEKRGNQFLLKGMGINILPSEAEYKDWVVITE